MKKVNLVLSLFLIHLTVVACSKKQESIYKNFANEEDGVIAIAIPENPDEEIDFGKEAACDAVDQLTSKEREYVRDLHEDEIEKLSFMVVDAETNTVVKSYLALEHRRLASITKLSTAIAALENVNNVSVTKISAMLKYSYNGEGSRYVHLAAKAIAGVTIPTKPYTEKHSCPDAFLEEGPLASTVFAWITEQIDAETWEGSSLHDGAGCHYDNFMTSLQTIRILKLAEDYGPVYGGNTFSGLLSISGKDGTWGNRNTDHKGYIFAKTGTLNPNSNLAGYFYAKRNKVMHKYYFNVFVEKKGGGAYTTKSRELIESLMRYWINFTARVSELISGPFKIDRKLLK